MSENEKIRILSNMFENLKKVDEKDRTAVMAYIQGTKDTRDRIELEKEAREKIK